jgi:hypothetical protein
VVAGSKTGQGSGSRGRSWAPDAFGWPRESAAIVRKHTDRDDIPDPVL